MVVRGRPVCRIFCRVAALRVPELHFLGGRSDTPGPAQLGTATYGAANRLRHVQVGLYGVHWLLKWNFHSEAGEGNEVDS